MHHTIRFFRCFFCNRSFPENVRLFIQPDTASVSADRPVFILVMVNLSGAAHTVTAFRAVMCFPLCALRANSVRASKIFCRFFTAVLAHLAIGTDFHAVFTFAALHTESGAVGAVFTAVDTDVIRTVTAIVAVVAHDVGTVNADATVGTEFIHTSGAFAAVLADVFRAVCTDDTAVLTDIRAVAALSAILAVQISRTLAADVTGGAEFIRTVRAFLPAVRAKIRAVFTALSAGANRTAVRTESAGYAEAVRAGTVNAGAAFGANLALRAGGTLFIALRADDRTVGTAFSAGADRLHTFVAERAYGTEILRPDAVNAVSAIGAQLAVCTFAAMLTAFGADHGTVRTPLTAAETDVIHAVFTDGAGIAEAAFSAHAFTAYAAIGTKLIRGAIGAFFAALRTDFRAVGTALTTSHADIIHARFTDTAVVTEVIFAARAVAAGAAFGAQLILGTVGTLFAAALAYHFGTLITSVSAGTQNFNAFTAFAAFGAVFAACAVKTALAIGTQLIIGAVFAFFAASHTDY